MYFGYCHAHIDLLAVKILYTGLIFLLFCNTLQGQDLEQVKEKLSFKGKKPLTFHGNLSTGIGGYSSNSPNKRTAPLNWYVSGNPTVSIYGISLPFNFTYNETGRSLTHPFVYQFYGVSPRYKWITVHLGFRSLNFTDYTMTGMLFKGWGLELSPKKMRFAVFNGVTNQAVMPDTSSGANGIYLASYKRTLKGIKLGVGKGNTFTDVSLIKGKDDSSSLPYNPELLTIKPAENLALGVKSRIGFGKHWYIEGDGGLSLYTKNVRNDSILVSSFLNKINEVITVNTTSSIYYAGHVMLGTQYKKWGISSRVREISNEYKTMGMYFVQGDIREYSVSPNLRLFKNRLTINSTLGFYKDNISGLKATSTIRNIFNFNTNILLIKNFVIGANYANFGTSRTNGTAQLNDSVRFSVINQSMGVNIGYQIKGKVYNQAIQLVVNQQTAADRNEFTERFTNSNTKMANVSYNINQLKTGMQFSSGISIANFTAYQQNNTLIGPMLQASSSFFKKKLRLSAGVNYSQRFLNGNNLGNVSNFNMQTQWTISKNHQLTASGNMILNNTGIISNSTLNEKRWNIRYNFQF